MSKGSALSVLQQWGLINTFVVFVIIYSIYDLAFKPDGTQLIVAAGNRVLVTDASFWRVFSVPVVYLIYTFLYYLYCSNILQYEFWSYVCLLIC